MQSRPWTRNEEIVVFNLYCKIPFQKSSKFHPEVIKIANLIKRTPSSVNMKIGNFGSFDDNLKTQGIVGLSNASKLDRQIWDEFNGKWDDLSYLSEALIAKLRGTNIEENFSQPMSLGSDKLTVVKRRVNQEFFRTVVLNSYNNRCCVTGIAVPELLVASHIMPWKDSSETERTNPRNGLCLNSLHDKAFDKGFITITTDYRILVSNKIKSCITNKILKEYFIDLNNTKISLPDKFLPDKLFLEYHNDLVFLK